MSVLASCRVHRAAAHPGLFAGTASHGVEQGRLQPVLSSQVSDLCLCVSAGQGFSCLDPLVGLEEFVLHVQAHGPSVGARHETTPVPGTRTKVSGCEFLPGDAAALKTLAWGLHNLLAAGWLDWLAWFCLWCATFSATPLRQLPSQQHMFSVSWSLPVPAPQRPEHYCRSPWSSWPHDTPLQLSTMCLSSTAAPPAPALLPSR